MRALTVTPPWGGLLAAGLKPIENRPQPIIARADFGERFALHAGRAVDESVYDRIRQIAPELWTFDGWSPFVETTWPAWYRLSRITSAVIATARVTRCVVMQDNGVDARDMYTGELVDLGEQRRWFFGLYVGLYGYLLADVRVLANPVPMRGWQGFWRIKSEEKVREIEAQIAEAA